VDGFGASYRGTKRKRTADISQKSEKHSDSQVADEREFSSDQSASDSNESEFQGFGDDSEDIETDGALPQSAVPVEKYIPPAARKAMTQVSAADEDPKLRKQVQGLLNRYDITSHSSCLIIGSPKRV